MSAQRSPVPSCKSRDATELRSLRQRLSQLEEQRRELREVAERRLRRIRELEELLDPSSSRNRKNDVKDEFWVEEEIEALGSQLSFSLYAFKKLPLENRSEELQGLIIQLEDLIGKQIFHTKNRGINLNSNENPPGILNSKQSIDNVSNVLNFNSSETLSENSNLNYVEDVPDDTNLEFDGNTWEKKFRVLSEIREDERAMSSLELQAIRGALAEFCIKWQRFKIEDGVKRQNPNLHDH